MRQACRRRDLLTDYAFPEWEMLMRLCIGSVEVFGQSDEDYQAWLESLRRNNVRLDIPSPAWSRLSVLWIATGVGGLPLALRVRSRISGKKATVTSARWIAPSALCGRTTR